MHKGDAASTI